VERPGELRGGRLSVVVREGSPTSPRGGRDLRIAARNGGRLKGALRTKVLVISRLA
jgi:hypothetical protein